MNFVEKILTAGFIEQGQKRLLELMPHKEKWIPRWWESYNTINGWLGVTRDNPDAWFKKEGVDKELILSLQGAQTPYPQSDEDRLLMQQRAARYICLKIGKEKIYESFSGITPTAEIINRFLSA